jgi:hypothetical protein
MRLLPVFGPVGLAALAMVSGCQQGQSGKDAATPAASQALPDWSGAWAIDRGTSSNAFEAGKEALKPGLVKDSDDPTLARVLGVANFREENCRPVIFSGTNGGGEGLFEFLFTPGRVTLISEPGLVRRIYTAGQNFTPDTEATTAVSSAGHWEGQTLVVDTKLNPNAGPFRWGTDTTRVGPGAHLQERISLSGPDTLRVDAVMEAPNVLTKPVALHQVFNRVRDYYLSSFSGCPPVDPGLDPKTGRPRLDLTPPADLPPPPGE